MPSTRDDRVSCIQNLYARYNLLERALGARDDRVFCIQYHNKIIIKISNVNMYILCDLKGQCLNHDHVVYEYMIAECVQSLR